MKSARNSSQMKILSVMPKQSTYSTKADHLAAKGLEIFCIRNVVALESRAGAHLIGICPVEELLPNL